jgi:hypothetical protein
MVIGHATAPARLTASLDQSYAMTQSAKSELNVECKLHTPYNSPIRAHFAARTDETLRETSEAAELGSCLTDATRESRSRRIVRIVAAMLRPERVPQQ